MHKSINFSRVNPSSCKTLLDHTQVHRCTWVPSAVYRDLENPLINKEAVKKWIENTPEMTLDFNKPEVDMLIERIKEYWIPDETIIYIGMTKIFLVF